MLPQHHTGHNSGGALAIVGLLGRALATVALGWASETARLPASLGGVHSLAAHLFLGLVGVHLAGVLIGGGLHRENLPRALLTGRKLGEADEANDKD